MLSTPLHFSLKIQTRKMEADDPFASITELCRVSSSQEELLRHCPFAGQPEVEEEETDTQVSGEIDEQLTGIMMVTPPESPHDNVQNYNNTPKENENFETPPKKSQIARSVDRRDDRTVVVEEEIEGGCTEREKTVNLGADTDLGFSEVELTQRSGSVNEVIQSELNKIRVLKRELAARECLIESLKKKSKISDNNLCSESPKQCLGEGVKKIVKSMEKLNSNIDSSYNCGDKAPQSNQNSQAIGKSSAKRKLGFSTKNLELETEGLGFSEGLEHRLRNIEGDRSASNNRNGEGTSNLGRKSTEDIDKYRYSGASARNSSEMDGRTRAIRTDNGEGTSNLGRKSMEDIDKYRYTGPSAHNTSEMGRRTRAIRALPVSICGKGEKDARNDYGEITLLDVLRMLARKCDYDHSLESKSILDVAKSRGMTFP